jgi:hypothetical protein
MILRIKSDYSMKGGRLRNSARYGDEWGDKEALKIIPSIMRGWYNSVSIVRTLYTHIPELLGSNLGRDTVLTEVSVVFLSPPRQITANSVSLIYKT